jgi:hypothetical protein
MSVYQVEEFYIHIAECEVSESTIDAIKELLSNEGWRDYEIKMTGQIVVDGIPSEHEALELEEKIQSLIKGVIHELQI